MGVYFEWEGEGGGERFVNWNVKRPLQWEIVDCVCLFEQARLIAAVLAACWLSAEVDINELSK